MIARDQQEHIEKDFRIPVDSSCPGVCWIISLAAESMMPSDEELEQLQSYREFSVRHTYAESYQEVILKRRLPYDSGHNTVIFRKSARGWLFRRLSWENPFFLPSPDKINRPRTLVEIMDKIEDTIPDRWEKWKREHPEIFPPASDTTPPAK